MADRNVKKSRYINSLKHFHILVTLVPTVLQLIVTSGTLNYTPAVPCLHTNFIYNKLRWSYNSSLRYAWFP
jgi:hypothetical protein